MAKRRQSSNGHRELQACLLDHDHFAKLYVQHSPMVRAWLARYGASEHLDDMVQEVFLRAWNSRKAYQGRASVSTWLVGIARKVAVDHLRQQTRSDRAYTVLLSFSGQREATASGIPLCISSAEYKTYVTELHGHILQSTVGLPLIYRQAIELGICLDLGNAEAAKLAGCRPKVFRTQLSRALKKVRRALGASD